MQKHITGSVFLSFMLLAAGCTTSVSYHPESSKKASDQTSKPASRKILVYELNDTIDRPYTVIGHISVGDTGFTMSGGSFEAVVQAAVEKARHQGADAIKLTRVKKPSLWSTIYRIKADVIVFDTP